MIKYYVTLPYETRIGTTVRNEPQGKHEAGYIGMQNAKLRSGEGVQGKVGRLDDKGDK